MWTFTIYDIKHKIPKSRPKIKWFNWKSDEDVFREITPLHVTTKFKIIFKSFSFVLFVIGAFATMLSCIKTCLLDWNKQHANGIEFLPYSLRSSPMYVDLYMVSVSIPSYIHINTFKWPEQFLVHDILS